MSKRFLFISLILAVYIAAVVFVLRSLVGNQPANVIVITVESLRHDLVDMETTPNLLAAGEKGFRFLHHRAVSGWTGNNIVSLLTGLTPFASGVHTRGQSVAPGRGLPLKLLDERGYSVEGIQGFMLMDIYNHLGLQVNLEYNDWLYFLADKIVAGRPFFAWHHYLHTHLPYTLMEGYPNGKGGLSPAENISGEAAARLALVRRQSAVHQNEATFLDSETTIIHDLQKSSIQEFDRWFEKFWLFYENSGLWRNTILVLTADHGDEHGERGMVGHASTTLAGHLHEEIIRVPLFVWLPEDPAWPQDAIDTQRVTSHEDIMPTLLELLQVSHDIPLTGRNIFSPAEGSRWMAMTSSGGFAEPDPDNIRYFEYGILADRWKLLYRTDHLDYHWYRLYDLEQDPGESRNLAAAEPGVVHEMKKQLDKRIGSRTIHLTKLQRQDIAGGGSGEEPVWLYPKESGTFSYDDLEGRFKLAWSGEKDADYLLEYAAGSGRQRISGVLEVDGPSKDFGKISRRYWNTWIVAYSPFRIRVSEAGRSRWSSWLDLEAIP